MLFNSYVFILGFLPITLIGYFWLARRNREFAIFWLVLVSLFFYGWWNPVYLPLIVSSMLVNFLLGQQMGRHRESRAGRYLLGLGVVLNLSVIGYFKYAGFIVFNLNMITGGGYSIGDIVLPLAISFFTFQQIAYLVDCYKGLTDEYNFVHYALFVTFFPQLIAGPIVHHKEMMPQFMRGDALNPRLSNLVVGLTIFAIGLFKKTVLADGAAQYATPVFTAAANGEVLTFFEAWGGSLAYTFQLYFDFSGYSDMAIGAARLFGIRLPLNFHSPYKATSIVEFWRRWHMTLSRFLRDYLYIPLGGSKRGRTRRYANLMVTMLLGGLWHGAGWTFVVWGALHGFYLIVNHAWHRVRGALLPGLNVEHWAWRSFAWSLTFVAVVVGWVFFRATDFDSAVGILQGMAGLNGVALPNAIMVRIGGLGELLRNWGVTAYIGGGTQFFGTYAWLAVLLPIALIMPNTQEFMRKYRPALKVYKTVHSYGIQPLGGVAARFRWRPRPIWAGVVSVLGALGFLGLTNISEFLYFQF